MDAGWYNDPFGRFAQRYHDGDEWTSHVSAGDGRSLTDPSGSVALIGGQLSMSPPTGAAVFDQGGRPVDIANPWVRLAAWLLDWIVVGIPLAFLSFSFIDWTGLQPGDTPDIPISYYVVTLGVAGSYSIGMVGTWGRTLGKMACGITIVTASGRSQPGYGTAAARWLVTALWFLPAVGVLIFIASVVMLFADSKRQMLQDKVARTMVVRAP